MSDIRSTCHDTLQLVVMGVSGSGKSTLAQAISQAMGLERVDGDDLHLPGSVAKMRAGIALDDADRWPWLDRIGHWLADEGGAGGRVAACSALKRAYRDRIRALAPRVRFVFLRGEPELVRARMALRTGHYMQPGLLASQFQTLEAPGLDEVDVIALSIDQPVEVLLEQAMNALARGPVGQAVAL
jgi:gluconokinase